LLSERVLFSVSISTYDGDGVIGYENIVSYIGLFCKRDL